METEKTGPSDNPYYQEGDGGNDNSGQINRKRQEEYEESVEEREVLKKERDEERQAEISQLIKKGGEKREEGAVTKKEGEAKPKKVYDHNKGKEGVYDRRGKVRGYQRKINKAFETKVHGIPSKKKKWITDVLEKGIERKSEATQKEVDVILNGIACKNFNRAVFKKIFKKAKEEGVDLKKYKAELNKFNRRDVGKFKEALGEGGSRKHKLRPDSNRISNRTSRLGSSSSMPRSRNRF